MRLNRIIQAVSLSVSFMLTGVCFSQNQSFESVQKAFELDNYKEVELSLRSIDTSSLSNYDKATWYYYHAEYQSKIDNHHIAYQNVIYSKKLFESLNESRDVVDCNLLLLGILSHQNRLKINTDDIIKELEDYALKQNDSNVLRSVYQSVAVKYLNLDDAENSIKYFKKIIPIALHLRDTVRVGHSYTNIGTVHYSILNDPDSSLYFAKKAVPILIRHKDFQTLAYNYNNQALQYKLLKDYNSAIDYYTKADSIQLKENIAKSKVIFYKNISDLYIKTKDYKKASTYLDKLNKLKDSINDIDQNIAISEIKEEFDNEKLRADNAEKEKERLESEAKSEQFKSLLFGSIGLLLFGGILAFLIQKNTKRKQLLAEQEKEIQKQKVSTLLKDQEINSINAMIEGQEKERGRIANDLHDDLGGLMATIKLQFNALKEKQTPDLFNKINTLLDDAYNKIRSIAHAKNSGVIAKQGLLKAIENMATNVSSASNTKIEVTDHGLENRLENSLEITIFRIIQELTTNIIKHAEATETHISLTNHDDSLNIMVEDNGKGFNTNSIAKNKGMGLHSIEKRIEHLEGDIKIESQDNQGTTIIIDIPI